MKVDDVAPFRSDHPFFASMSLLPHDSPNTLWRTHPGSAPGTLAAAVNAAAVGVRTRQAGSAGDLTTADHLLAAAVARRCSVGCPPL